MVGTMEKRIAWPWCLVFCMMMMIEWRFPATSLSITITQSSLLLEAVKNMYQLIQINSNEILAEKV